MPRRCSRRCLAASGALSTLLLIACGGGDDHADALPTDAAALTAGTLLDDDGGTMPADPRAVPIDADGTAVPRHYATAMQALDLQRALGPDVLEISVGCCDEAAVTRAISAATPSLAPAPRAVLIRGGDTRLAATVVNRLSAAGLERVWWVAP